MTALTSGIGLIPEGIDVSSKNARVGDKIILSGSLADHGVTILTQREGLTFDAPVKSDSAPLNHMVADVLKSGCDVHVLRDPTRGGVGTTLNEIAGQSQAGIRIYEAHLPIRPDVAGVCDLLGFDPLYVANEGKLIAVVPGDQADAALAAMKAEGMEYDDDDEAFDEVYFDVGEADEAFPAERSRRSRRNRAGTTNQISLCCHNR